MLLLLTSNRFENSMLKSLLNARPSAARVFNNNRFTSLFQKLFECFAHVCCFLIFGSLLYRRLCWSLSDIIPRLHCSSCYVFCLKSISTMLNLLRCYSINFFNVIILHCYVTTSHIAIWKCTKWRKPSLFTNIMELENYQESPAAARLKS